MSNVPPASRPTRSNSPFQIQVDRQCFVAAFDGELARALLHQQLLQRAETELRRRFAINAFEQVASLQTGLRSGRIRAERRQADGLELRAFSGEGGATQ